jgi:hypothetical protein
MCTNTAILCNQKTHKENLDITCPNNQLRGWWTFSNLVFWWYPCRMPSGGVIGALVHRPLAMFHWLQLHNLTRFPLHDKITPNIYGMSHGSNITAPHLKDVVSTWQQSCALSSLTIQFTTLQTHKSPYNQLICALYSACLSPRTVQLWSVKHRTFTACTHLATAQYCTVWSPSVSRSSTRPTQAFPLQTTATVSYTYMPFHFTDFQVWMRVPTQ